MKRVLDRSRFVLRCHVQSICERERERKTRNTIITQNRYKEKKWYVCMNNAWTCDVLKEIASWVQPNSNLVAHKFSTIKHTSKCTKHCENANRMQCMIIYHQINNTQPKTFTKISKIFKNPKISKKTQKPRSKCVKCMKNEDLGVFTTRLKLEEDEILKGMEIWVKEGCLKGEKKKKCWETNERNEI